MSVIRSGFDAYRTPKLTDNIKHELDCAKEGLCKLNVNPEYMDILYRRLEIKTSVGDKVANL